MPTDNWHLRTKLYGLDLDLQTLTVTNHHGHNDRAIAELERVRADIRQRLAANRALDRPESGAARPAPPPSPPFRVSLFDGETTAVAIVASSDEASALFARWVMRRGGGGMIARKAEASEYKL